MDARGSPLRVLPAHPLNEFTQAPIDLRPPCPVSGFPSPIPAKARTVPSQNGLRLHDPHRAEQLGPRRVIHNSNAQSLLRRRNRGGARLRAMPS